MKLPRGAPNRVQPAPRAGEKILPLSVQRTALAALLTQSNARWSPASYPLYVPYSKSDLRRCVIGCELVPQSR